MDQTERVSLDGARVVIHDNDAFASESSRGWLPRQRRDDCDDLRSHSVERTGALT